MEYPELAARTRRFTSGAPRAINIGADGARVVFLRSAGPEDPVDALHVFDTATGVTRLVADPMELLSRTSTGQLPATERALRERLRLSASGIGAYAIDRNATVAAFPLGGRLFRASLTDASGISRAGAGTAGAGTAGAGSAGAGSAGARTTVTELQTPGGVVDPRPDPTGARIAYVSEGALRIVDATGDQLIAGEPGVSWGLAEFIAAEEFGRFRGYWWAPDGQSILATRVDEVRVPRWTLHDPASPAEPARTVAYPYAGAANAEVTLHLLDLDGGWVDVHWDRETYPYLVDVSWTETGGPLVAVLRRLQQHGLVLAVDPRTGETQVHAELADPRWVEPVPGTPAYLPDGRVLIGGELGHDGYDARCLFADGSLLTPPSLYVRRVAGGLPGGDLLVEASDGEPSEQHLYVIGTQPGAPVLDSRRLTTEPGWHSGFCGGGTVVVGSASLDHAGSRWRVLRDGATVGELENLAAAPPYAPRPALERVTDRQLPAAVLYPTSHVAGRRLPVIVDVYGGPAHQEVRAARAVWLVKQWFADAGFAVVTVDNRGTPGVTPAFEKAIHRRLADVILTDQVDGLAALAEKHPDLDMSRVAIRGWSFGGWLAAMAVLRRPDVYHAGIAGAPVTDWALYDTAYTERYLGLPRDGSDVYAHHSLVELATEPVVRPGDARPLLLIHGLSDDNVVAAHTLRLSAALLAAGRPHSVLPLPGASHMAAGGIAERLLRLEVDFLRRHLG